METFEIDIDGSDGKKMRVVLKRITRGEKKTIAKLVAPKELNPNDTEGLKISFDAWQNYQDELLKLCIVSPENLKTNEGISNLLDVSFNALFNKAQEINGLLNFDATEKK